MVGKTVFFIYGAYYDNRDLLDDGPVVRLLVLTNAAISEEKVICQLWFGGNETPLETPVEQENLHSLLLNDDDESIHASPSYMLTCKAPSDREPEYVSLVSKSCDQARNLIYVANKSPDNGIIRDFLVVVRDLNDEEDKSSLIVEWLEILKQLGASNVHFYVTKAHENVMKVLKFYEAVEFVTFKIMKYPDAIDSTKVHKNSLIPLHDSLYGNLNLYNLIVPLDINELIIPSHENDRTWRDLLVRANDKRLAASFFDLVDAFPVHSVNFYVESEDVQDESFYFFANTRRATDFNPQGQHIKSFMSIQQVKTFNYQLPYSCLQRNNCVIHYIDRVDGQLSRYVEKYDELSASELEKYYDDKEHSIEDKTLLRYEHDVTNDFRNTLKHVFNV